MTLCKIESRCQTRPHKILAKTISYFMRIIQWMIRMKYNGEVLSYLYLGA